ncbi:selenide, water dikinase SelD [Pseudohalioglobus lutimaris]|nr:selenide, water dikinase SelD [Pseudohalioglobus lutimaris]
MGGQLMRSQPILQQDLVFVGGGHAHALVLRMLAMEPVVGLRLTLISPASHTPYSGMLPGLVAGHYSFEQTHIDLARLCQWAGVRFIEAEVTGLDPQRKTLSLAGRPAIAYDFVSIDIGSQPELDSVPGARDYSVPVKPVADLWRRWREMDSRLAQRDERAMVAVVGGGAGSVELALAMAHSLSGSAVEIALFCGAPEIMQGYNAGARAAAVAALARSGIQLHLQSRVVAVSATALQLETGEEHRFDDLFWCTGAAAAPWVAASGLSCDARGFLQVSDTLQSMDDPSVFAAGDIATQINHPRPKAGVYAVRQGPVLAHNLRALLLGKALRQHRPQRRFLSLVSLGDRRATADRGPFYATGEWVWRWKDRIDREFMGRFTALPELTDMSGAGVIAGAVQNDAEVCGGCGAKVGARGLAGVLTSLAVDFPRHCPRPEDGDDASPIPNDDRVAIVQSLDLLRQLVADPWLMGRIAANHALSDLYACAAQPLSALAAVTLPFARASLLQRDLQQVLAGALHEFSRVDCQLTGGHSMQGPELLLGFAVNGRAMDPRRGLLGKRGARDGDVLVLTKPLGTGVLFAAHMRQLADGRDIAAATAMMLQSNFNAARLALTHGASACTDITGFGLLGHLLEMLGEKQMASLRLSTIPALPGALEQLAAGVRSTMHEANAEALESATIGAGDNLDLLLDPQTSGGLLLALDPGQADEYCAQLHAGGLLQAAKIGRIESSADLAGGVRVKLQ